jgi:hypothetical protein
MEEQRHKETMAQRRNGTMAQRQMGATVLRLMGVKPYQLAITFFAFMPLSLCAVKPIC